MEEQSNFDSFELAVDNDIKTYLKETANWTLFLAILGFIGVGFMVLAGIVMFVMDTRYPDIRSMGITYSYIGILYIIMAVAYVFPVYYLFNFSQKIKSALSLNNNTDFKAAFASLKSHFKYLGISVIAIIVLYIAAMAVMVFSIM
ncbi:MAG: DUF5362 family protein [Flavobacteriaceae bacterium]